MVGNKTVECGERNIEQEKGDFCKELVINANTEKIQAQPTHLHVPHNFLVIVLEDVVFMEVILDIRLHMVEFANTHEIPREPQTFNDNPRKRHGRFAYHDCQEVRRYIQAEHKNNQKNDNIPAISNTPIFFIFFIVDFEKHLLCCGFRDICNMPPQGRRSLQKERSRVIIDRGRDGEKDIPYKTHEGMGDM